MLPKANKESEQVVILVLIVEIVSALVALALVVAMVASWVRSAREKRAARSAPPSDKSRARHRTLSMVLVAAVIVHGACATVYASGANPLAYVFGWAALALLVASGACMMPPLRSKLAHASTWHNGLFVAALALIVAHAVAGRL